MRKFPFLQDFFIKVDMLMRILLSFGGVCTFDQILDDVQKVFLFPIFLTFKKNKQWKSVRPWVPDTKRALLASLSHNPPGNFKVRIIF